MLETKSPQARIAQDVRYDETSGSTAVVTSMGATTEDTLDMIRMGKTQETRRAFRSFSILGFSMVVLSTWEAILVTAVFALTNGGTAGLIWGYLIVMVGFGFVVASLAEMASMAPTAGGQYHWVSEFAPPSCQKFLSYIIGWLGVLGWQTGAATVSYLASKNIQGLIVLNDLSYAPTKWQGTLLIWGVLLLSLFLNTFFSKYLPLIEGVTAILHIAGFFAVIVPLWVMGERSSPSKVFTVFEDSMGWNSIPLAVILGLISASTAFVGAEAAAHMSEEVKDASRVIPRIMMWTWLGNGLMGWVMAITFCFCVGDTVTILATPTGVPVLQVFLNTAGSVAGANGLTSILIVIGLLAAVAMMAANSRQLFAFARDNGVPFSRFFSKVHPTLEVPVNSVYMTLTVVIALSLVNLGSEVAFLQVMSLGVGSMLTSYAVSIGCVALKRIRGEPLLLSKFDLGRWGLVVNIVALVFLLFCWIFTFFPVAPRPGVAEMNWACMGYALVLMFATIYYVIHGKHVYVGPVEYVRKG